jgi:hypothetical protein
MDGMRGENFNDLSSKALGSNGLDPDGVKLWNECFAPGGGGDLLVTMTSTGCRIGDPQYYRSEFSTGCRIGDPQYARMGNERQVSRIKILN